MRIRAASTASVLIASLVQLFGRSRFEPADFEGRNANSGLFSLMFLALRRAGARDWRSGLEISLAHKGTSHVLQWHHIFPKAILKSRYERREVNDIANLAFIGGGTNRRISDSKPEIYLPRVIEERGPEALEGRKCVPLNPDLWAVEAYPQFLEERRRLLAAAVNRRLDSLTARIAREG